MFSDIIDPKNWAYYNRKAVRAAKRAKKQRLMKDIFGYDLVRSDFLAFDPFHDFTMSDYFITARNRLQKKTGSSGYPRKRTRVSTDTVHDTVLYAAAPGVNRRHPTSLTNYSSSKLESALTSQPVITGFIHDTTKRTRGSYSDFGEAEMFLPRLHVPKSTYSWLKYEAEVAGTDTFGPYKRIDRTMRTTSGITARITQATVDTYRTLEQSRFSLMAQDRAISLLPDAVPLSREFSFLREIGELKDVPRLLQSSVENIRQLYENGSFNPFDQFLSKEFGWDPLVSAVLDMVNLPDKIAKRVNDLIARIGKEKTTFRSRSRETEVIPGATGFTFDPLIDESALVPSHVAFRITEWRLALNYGVKFPKLELPQLKEWVSARLWGAKFRPDDFYNLVPWSWLVDWFGGLGDYIEAFTSVQDETSLANYGFLTYESNGFVYSNAQGKLTGTRSTRFDGGPIVTTNTEVATNHTAVLKYKYLRRIDVTSVSELKRTWFFDELSTFQASILSALAFKR